MSWIDLWKRTGSRLLFALPESFRWWLARGIAFLWWDVFRIRRFTLYRNVTIAFPGMPKAERRALVRESLVHLGFNFFEILVLPYMGPQFVQERVQLHGLENLLAAEKQGRGVLALCLHIGNGDFGASVLAQLGHRTSIISKRFKSKFWDDLWFGLRGAHGVRYIEAHGPKTAFDILKATKNNEIVAFVVDQFMGRPYGIPSTFFGRDTGTAYGLALFAAKTRAPVIPIWTWREPPGPDGPGKIHVLCEPEILLEKEEDRDLQMSTMTEKYNRKLEEIIRARPEQWMWVHRRWKRWE